jgi:hypothetical protein
MIFSIMESDPFYVAEQRGGGRGAVHAFCSQIILNI